VADPIRLEKFADQPRQVRARSQLPKRDQGAHGAHLRDQLSTAVAEYQQRLLDRQETLPNVPEGIQLLIKGATTSSGRSLLESAKLKDLKLEVIEERQDGLVIALSPDPKISRLGQAVEDFRTDTRTPPTEKRPQGTRKRGVNTVFTIDDLQPTPRDLRMGDELSDVEIKPDQHYVVDIEIAAGRDLEDEGAQRREQFSQYLRGANAQIVGSGPIIEEDYALYRADVTGRLLEDLLDIHIWVKYVDLPPQVEREGLELRNMREPNLPTIATPLAGTTPICIIDSGVVTQHPLVAPAMNGNGHRSFIPGDTEIGDVGSEGHGTAVASIAALGSLRTSLLGGSNPVYPVSIVLAKVLDDQARLPPSVNMKVVLPDIVQAMRQESNVFIFNHSIASRAQFNPQRMSVWAETIDRVVFADGGDGGDGCLFIVCTGNIDGYRPTWPQVENDMDNRGHPIYLLDSVYRIRNPAQAINALTVGSYVSNGLASFGAHSSGRTPIASSDYPSPFTRTGFGYLGEIKPEVVEEGGNWYSDNTRRLAVLGGDLTDVALAAHDFATTGRLIKFGSATSWAAPRVAHLAAHIQAALQTRNVDLIRALIINSARWPIRFAATEQQLRMFGYGVPDRERALNIGGPRSVILIEDSISIGNVHLYRIPWPSGLFEQLADLQIYVSITLAYRAPVRKSNRKYRGTVLEWKLSKRGEPFEDFRNRSVYQGIALSSGEEDDTEEEEGPSTIADWPWVVKTNRRKCGTAQKDWFEAPASYFGDELYLSVIGKRGWLTKKQQEEGWHQRYAVAVSIEVIGQNIPLHERIAQQVQVPVLAGRAG
jgi:hypothetical protein